MLTPEEKGEELIEFFMNTQPPKMSDYSRLYRPTAILFAKKVCDEVDINKVREYFSYEHFYVLYCVFWDLDGPNDHDFLLSKEDFSK